MKGCVARGIPRGSGPLRAALAEVVGMRFQRGGQGAAGLADPRTPDPAGGIPGLGATSLPRALGRVPPQQPSALIQKPIPAPIPTRNKISRASTRTKNRRPTGQSSVAPTW